MEEVEDEGSYPGGQISDWGSDLVGILGDLGLTQYFSFVVVSAVVGRAKPSPDIFRYALDRAGVEAEEAAYVGDLMSRTRLGRGPWPWSPCWLTARATTTASTA